MISGFILFPIFRSARTPIKFSLTGFKTTERTGIGLVIAQVARVDIVLETGEISETVTVSANAELINKDNALVSTVMQSETITDLPLSFAGRPVGRELCLCGHACG